MAINLPGGFNILNNEPVDARLTLPNSSSRYALSQANVYEGLSVYQQDDKNTYVLINTSSISDPNSWKLLGSGTDTSSIFIRNQTNTSSIDIITINQSIFNPSNLKVMSSSMFVIQTDADYYILGDLINSGSINVNGTLKVGGVLYVSGSITGTGIIE